MDTYIFGIFAVLYLLVLAWGLKKHKKTASAILFLVVIALVYDNAILAIGHLIGEGDLLYALNIARFWIHALFTPTLILFSYYVLKEANVSFAQKSWVKISFVIYMLIAIIVEYFVELKGLTLELQQQYDVVSYASAAESSGPPPMILLVLVALLFAAVVLVKKSKWWWMLIGTIVMTIGSAIPINVDSNAITNAFELFLIFTLMKTAIHFSKQHRY